MVVILNNACNIFVQFILPLFTNNTITVLHRENRLNMNLGVGICHGYLYSVPDGTLRLIRC